MTLQKRSKIIVVPWQKIVSPHTHPETDCACGNKNLVLTDDPTACPVCGRKYRLILLLEIEKSSRKKRN